MGWAAKGPGPALGLPPDSAPRCRVQPQGAWRDGSARLRGRGSRRLNTPFLAAREGRRGGAHRGPLWRAFGWGRRVFPGSFGNPGRHFANRKAGRGWAPGEGLRPSPLEGARDPRSSSLWLLGRAGGQSPPRAPSCPGEPNGAIPTPTAPGCPWLPPIPKSWEESPGPNPRPLPRVQAPEAGRRGAPPSTEQLPSQTPAGSEAPSGPGGLFGERRKSELEPPKRPVPAFSPSGLARTAQGLDQDPCAVSTKGTESHKDSSSTGGSHRSRPGPRDAGEPTQDGGGTAGQGLPPWSLSRRTCPGNGDRGRSSRSTQRVPVPRWPGSGG